MGVAHVMTLAFTSQRPQNIKKNSPEYNKRGVYMTKTDSIWYAIVDGSQEGPFNFPEIVAAVAAGRLKAQDLIWCPGLPTWEAAASIPGLFTPPQISQEDHHRGKAEPSSPPGLAVDEASRLGERAELSAALPLTNNHDPDGGANTKVPNYFIRHWKGDLNLGLSYWLNGFLLNILVVAMVGGYTIYANGATDQGVVKSFTILNVFIAFLIAGTVWQVVGVWRSASKSPGRGGSRLWAVLAQLMMIVGVIRFVGEFSTGIAPIYSRFAEIIFVEEPAKELTVRPILDGRVIEFSGEIKVGAHRAFRAALEAAPNAKIVKLTSIGGWISEANAIVQEIRERQLQTVVTASCVSACSYLFLSGSDRWLTGDARLGFHAPGNPVTNRTDQEDVEKQRRLLLALGVPKAMADKAGATPHSSMWYPTEFELQDAKLITGIVDRQTFDATGTIQITTLPDRLKQAFVQVPVFEAIRTAEPAIFEKFVAQSAADMSRGTGTEEALMKLRPLLQGVVKKYLPLASDESILRMAAINLQYMERWWKDDVMSCVAFSDPSKAPGKSINPGQYRDLNSQELALQAEIIRSGSRAPARVPTSDEINNDLIEVLRKINTVLPGKVDLLNKEKLALPEVDAYCQVNIQFYKQATSMQRASQVRLFRYMFANL